MSTVIHSRQLEMSPLPRRQGLQDGGAGFAVFQPDARLVFANTRFRELQEGIEAVDSPVKAHGSANEVRALGKYRFAEICRYPMPGGGTAVVITVRSAQEIADIRCRSRGEGLDSPTEIRRYFEKQADEMAGLAHALMLEIVQSEATFRSRSVFMAAMSHEFRTPLTAIIGFSHLAEGALVEGLPEEEIRERIQCIREAGEHLLELVNDILDMSKLEAGKHEPLEEAFRISDAIGPALSLVAQKAGDCGVEITHRVEDSGHRLYADKRMTRQILVNLLSNAIKFTPEGGRVALKVRCCPKDGCLIEVADNGIGMRADDIPKALAPFGQIDSDLGRRHQGTGLGLPLAKSLTELHGGSFDLQSKQGSGTTVALRFPPSRIVKPHDRND